MKPRIHFKVLPKKGPSLRTRDGVEGGLKFGTTRNVRAFDFLDPHNESVKLGNPFAPLNWNSRRGFTGLRSFHGRRCSNPPLQRTVLRDEKSVPMNWNADTSTDSKPGRNPVKPADIEDEDNKTGWAQ